MSAYNTVVDECCICMEALICTSNYVKTECGHQFHCSCLMKNTTHNGYGCPYCRAALAEEVLDDSDEEEEYEDERDTETDDVEYVDEEDETLLGLRLFTNRIEREVNDDDNAMELARIENDNTHKYYNDLKKKNANLREEYLKKREKYLFEQLLKHGIGMTELISWIQLEKDENDGYGNNAFTYYMDSSDLNEYDWNNASKIDGLIKSITKRFVSLNPPPVLSEIPNLDDV
jgi:hypothetical protein